ncbi:Putative glucosamine-fructose-6-phosphate aminotransferase [Microbacterium esteraromaticum]|uniref:Putative glucosamine-fructose-6-phosphate aminotransferase n=1 Tax=Microbacterium esteraromaticum TaxID=57043 RepID=A0A1R4IBR2_9MICO|nr:SIS domain-containing protein [Microbacterium esteraromaticum]SJN16733.1 Putative glucosamine-fructose-6-phosphate aminotransferase [Microbacterium esteraromaticum]
MTDGTYVGPKPVKPIPQEIRPSQENALRRWGEIRDWVLGLPALERVFLVGAGGSYSGLQAAHYLLDRESALPVVSVNSDEFYHRASPSVGPGALVIALSAAGATAETVRAASWAQERGAAVVAVTLKSDGPLAQAVSNGFISLNGDGNQIVLQLLVLATLAREGHDVSAKIDALHALPDATDAALRGFEPLAAAIAKDMKDVPVTYLLASGPLQGMGSTFTSCFLQEMQWMHAATINANEFFQGPFEVFDKQTKSILFLGEDATRPMVERAERFLSEHSGTTHRIDSRDLELAGVPSDQRGFIAPLVFYPMMFRLAENYASVRGYTLEGRRYMWQFAY